MYESKSSPVFVMVFVACLAAGGARVATAENIDPANDGSQYAYGENVGWLNAEQDTDGDTAPDQGVTVGDDALTGWIWGENIGWISLSCENTASCGTVDYGVANDGCGNLSGYAWAENAGWLNFSHTEGGVTVDPATGDFGGRAWAENLGWITFASAGPNPYKVKTSWTRSPPAGFPALSLTQPVPETTLSWTILAGATEYDVVEGDLAALRASGDFTSATTGCTADDHGTTSVTHSVTPAAEVGFWFLVRGSNCGGNGRYDSGGPGQDHARDGEINAAPGACP